MKELKVSQEFIIKRKNLFKFPFPEFQIYDKGKQVGRIKDGILEFYNKSYNFDEWPIIGTTITVYEANFGRNLEV